MNAGIEQATALSGGIDTERTVVGMSTFALPARPYPGLRPFKVSEWPIFFGREVMAEEVIRRLIRHQMVVVHGASGCGKSSLIFAGVLPQLARRARQRHQDLKLAEMRPGRAPLRTLAEALAAGCGIDDVDSIHRAVGKGRGAAAALEELLRAHGVQRVCLYVDQFEELFRFAQHGSAEEAALFVEVLIGIAGTDDEDDGVWWEREAEPGAGGKGAEGAGAAAEPRPGIVRLLLSMRSEFLGDCARFPGFAEVVNRTQYLLPGVGRADLLRSIRDPVELFDGAIELTLAERLADEAVREADPLPLVQHALMELWRDGGVMTSERYAAAVGADGRGSGLSRLLASHADEVLARSGAGDAVAEQLFRALTDIDPAGRAIRRPQRLDRLLALVAPGEQAAMRRIIDDFRAEDVAFLRPNMDERPSPLDDDQVIDISHEALLRAWPRIADPVLDPATGAPRGWLHREFEDGLVWRSLAVQARAFTEDPEACLDPATTGRRAAWYDAVGARAAWANRHLISRTGLPPGEEPEWRQVDALMIASKREQVRARWRRRLWQGLLALALIATIATLVIVARQRAAQNETLTSELIVAEGAAQSEAKVERAADARAATAAPTAAASAVGQDFAWLGSANAPNLLSLETGRPVPPAQARPGERYRLAMDLIVREALPRPPYSLARGRGYLPKGATVQLVAEPTAYARATPQYWGPIEAQTVLFGTLYLQFGGAATDDAAGQVATRDRVQRLSQGLQAFGYRVPGEERSPQAAGLNEVRYFHAADRKQAEVLASNVQRVGRAAGLRGVALPALRDLTRANRKTALGTIELWIDLGDAKLSATKAPVAPPAKQPRVRKAMASPAADPAAAVGTATADPATSKAGRLNPLLSVRPPERMMKAPPGR